MADLLIASLDFVGFLGFVVALIYSVKNFQKTKSISLTWLLMTIAMSALMIFTFLNFLEWSDIEPQIFDEIQDSLLPVAFVSLFTSALVSRYEFLKPLSK